MATFQDYFDELKGKKVAVIGIGISNTPLIRMLLRAGVHVTACDQNPREEFAGLAEELESLGAELRLGDEYLNKLNHDVIFRTPGMHPDTPALAKAREQGSIITSEMEVFFEVCPCKIIAVTGSDGKTTTTTIIAELMQKDGFSTYVGGNIGKPLLPEVPNMQAEDVAVLELSSFQLMTMTKSPDIAVVTNLAPNHLDIHKSMEEYISAKKNVFIHQSAAGKTIFNYDNDITRALALEAKGETVFFSGQSALDKGVFLQNDAICVKTEHGCREVLPLSDILLPGVHNVENYMAAIAAVDGLVPDETIRAFAKTFGGVEHRIELVRTLNGVRYYNDSIASSPSRTIAGLRSFQEKVILIAGGYDKHIPYNVMGSEIVESVKHLILTGDTASKIKAAVENAPDYRPDTPDITMIEDFRQAVLCAHEMAEPGDVVILSPASASFDKFKNFMARGDAFKEIIYGL